MVGTKETSELRNLKSPTFGLILLGIIGVTAGLIIGIDDNPPGVAALFGGLVCWTLAIVHRWQRPRSFLWLTLSALGCFVLFAVAHNVFYGVAEALADQAILKGLFTVFSVGSFLLAVIVAPPILVVGLIGMPIALWRSRRAKDQEEGTSEA
jgi:membrane-bound ClpP family serine protease